MIVSIHTMPFENAFALVHCLVALLRTSSPLSYVCACKTALRNECPYSQSI